MKRAAEYLVVYDISEQEERYRVAKILEGVGTRIQESVFQCRLGLGHMRKLRTNLEMDTPRSGFVLIYRVDTSKARIAIGAVPADLPAEEDHHFVV